MAYITHGVAARNRKAHFNYTLGETYEAGIMLSGPEVKSLRHGTSSLSEAFIVEREGELFLSNCHITGYQLSSFQSYDPIAPRKLLLHRKEIKDIMEHNREPGTAIIPLDIHFTPSGRAKVTIALATGKKKHDKRDAQANRDWARQRNRLMKRG